MPLYSYVATTEDGKRVSGIYKAESEDEVVTYLSGRGLIPVSVSLYGSVTKHRKRRKKYHYGIGIDDYLFLARQMSVMLEAGVPLLRVLDVIREETSSLKLSKTLESVREYVAGGWSLERAMSRFPDVFDKFWLSIVRTGEATGELGWILKRLADHIERQASFVKKIKSSLIYPAFLLSMTIFAVLFLSIFIIPKFKDLFEGFNQTLPALTVMVLAFSDFLRTKYVFLILGAIVLFFAWRIFIASPVGKRLWDIMVLEIPLLKDFVRVAIMQNVSANLAILSESGVPILTALDIVAESTNNYIVADYIMQIKSRVREGIPLASAFEETGFFDSIMTQMISVGEEIGDISGILNRVAKYYDEEMENKLIKFTSMFEPIMLLIMAGLIGLLVAAIFLPIFRMATLNVG